MNQLNTSFEAYDDLSHKLDRLFELGNVLEKNQALVMSSAMEADAIAPSKNILSIYFGAGGKDQKYTLATESIKDSIVEAVVKAYKYIADMIKKFIGWLVKLTKDVFHGSEKQVDDVKTVLKDHELLECMKDVDDLLASAGSAAMESARHGDGDHEYRGDAVKVTDVFEIFKRSLNEREVDFLTSGHQYKVIKDVVNEFSNGHYPQFISGFSDELQSWVREGLREAPHVGNDEDVVERFIYKRTRALNEIKQKYHTAISTIDELDRLCVNIPAQGDHEHLNLFQKKPSVLFPHIERIWETVKFERIGDADKKLLVNLEKIRKQFENDTKNVRSKLDSDKQPWPAVEGILRLAQRANREMLSYISSLVKVGGFIKNSANIAYHATVKSFSYITRLLNAIGKLPNVDRQKLNKCLDTIHSKRRAIDMITSIA